MLSQVKKICPAAGLSAPLKLVLAAAEPTDLQKMPSPLPSNSVFLHLKKNNTYIRMLFDDLSSAFNTISHTKLTGKINTLGFSTTFCKRISDLSPHTCHPETVWIGGHTSSTIATLEPPTAVC